MAGMPVFSNRHRSISTGFLVVSRKPLVGMWRQTVLLTWTEGVQVVFSTASLGWMFPGLGCRSVSSISFSLSFLLPETVLEA